MGKNVLFSTIAVAALAVAGHASATFMMDFPPEGCGPGAGCLHFDENAKDVSTTTGTVQFTTQMVTIDTVGNIDVGQGYATIKPVKGGTLTSLTFTPADDTAFNDFSTRGQVLDASDPVVITVTDQNGSSQTFDFTVPKANADFSRLGVVSVSGSGETIQSIVLSDAGGFKEVKQIDFSPVTTPVVPEPATWALMLIGLGAMGGVLRRRASSGVPAV